MNPKDNKIPKVVPHHTRSFFNPPRFPHLILMYSIGPNKAHIHPSSPNQQTNHNPPNYSNIFIPPSKYKMLSENLPLLIRMHTRLGDYLTNK